MKNLTIILGFSLAFTNIFSQGIPVSHTPEKKNVVLEEVTGIHCPNCPDGHKIAGQMQAAHPNDVFLINIHASSYAVPGAGEPDFRTSEGNYLYQQSGLTGVPAGSINRHVFSGWSMTAGKTAMSRSKWAAAADQILAQDAYANLGLEATIDVQTNLLTVHVQVYYTANSPQSVNRIHVALLQDNIEGPQSGQAANPSQILPNGRYNHINVLRKILSGTTGKTINSGLGTTVDEYFTYTVPADLIGVPIVLQDLKVVAFLTETTQEIINAQSVHPTFTNFPGLNSTTVVSAAVANDAVCGFSTAPLLTLRNSGSQALTSLYLDYSINGSPVKTMYWTGNIESIKTQEITLDDINFFPANLNVLTVNTRLPNGTSDPVTTDDTLTLNFNPAPDASNTVTMTLQLDYYGAEVSWEVLNSAGTQLYHGGPYTNVANPTSGPPLPSPITQTFNLTSGDCYELVTHDSYGDGILGTGTGFTLKDDQNLTVVSKFAGYGIGGRVPFGVDAPQPDSTDVFGTTSGIGNIAEQGQILVYPNPASEKINVRLNFANEKISDVYFSNSLGQRVKTLLQNETFKGQTIQIEISDLKPGIYFLNAEAAGKRYVEKVLVTF